MHSLLGVALKYLQSLKLRTLTLFFGAGHCLEAYFSHAPSSPCRLCIAYSTENYGQWRLNAARGEANCK